MSKFRPKNVYVRAQQFNLAEPWPAGVLPFVAEGERYDDSPVVYTPDGTVFVQHGDWIVTFNTGTQRVFSNDDFWDAYEEVRDAIPGE